MALSITTFSIIINKTLSKTILSITVFSITILGITTLNDLSLC